MQYKDGYEDSTMASYLSHFGGHVARSQLSLRWKGRTSLSRRRLLRQEMGHQAPRGCHGGCFQWPLKKLS